MDTIGKRIKYLRKQFQISQQEICKRTKISRSNISKLENDLITPTATALLALSEVFGVSADWIMMGKGSTGNMLLNKLNGSEEKDKDVKTEKHIKQKASDKNADENNLEHMYQLSSEEIYLILQFRKMPRIMQVRLEGYIEGMVGAIND